MHIVFYCKNINKIDYALTYYAPSVRESASSRIMILWRPGLRLTFFYAKLLIFSLTTSIPLSSEAFISKAQEPNTSWSSYLAKQSTELVFPIPGGPTKIMLGMLPSSAMFLNFVRASSFPWTSSRVFGRYLKIDNNQNILIKMITFYFSSQISFYAMMLFW